MGGNNGLKEAVSRAALREMAQVSANLSATVPESTSTDARPEQEAAERVKSGAVDTALTTGDLSLGAARAAYLRTKTMREKTLERKTAGPTDGGTREKEKPAALRDKPQTGQSIRLSTEAQRKDRVRRLLFAQKAVERQAERKSLQNTAGTAMSAPPSRLAHWQREGKRLAFQQAAMWRGQSGQNRAARGRVLPRPALRPHSFQTMRTRMQSAVGRVLNRLAAALAKTARAAVRTLAAWIGAGGIALLLVMVAGAAAAIISSPMGILFADETGDPNAIPIASIVQETNTAFGQAINEIVAAHPECDEVDIQYHYETGRTWQSYWPEVLAVFAVQTNLGEDGNVVVIDAANAQKIKDTFWAMHTITAEVETIEIEPETDEDEAGESGETDESGDSENPAPAPRYRYILHISVSGKTADEMAGRCHFTADQRDILHQLLSDEMRPMLLALCGGVPGDMLPGGGAAAGSLQWPLPGYTTISCGFGEPDAISGQPHKGIDIPAPEGTPILAAHSGTELISGWNDSYGNQVLLDSGTGISTRYTHMIRTAVSAGETVTTGQVIGYVGNTGDSTGDHLHFEVILAGVFTDPLRFNDF